MASRWLVPGFIKCLYNQLSKDFRFCLVLRENYLAVGLSYNYRIAVFSACVACYTIQT